MKYNDWQDEGGFFHIQRNPTKDGSENGPLFTAEVALFAEMNGFEIKKPDVDNLKVSDVKFRDRFNGEPHHFSHDNMTGLYCLKELCYTDMDLPIIRWDSNSDGKPIKYWLHPRDILFYTGMKYKALSPILLLLFPTLMIGYFLSLMIIAFVSLKRKREITSGKCLWFTRFGIMSVSKNLFIKAIGKVGLKLSGLILRPQHGKQPFIDVFDFYFENEGHPCREEIRKYYENLK